MDVATEFSTRLDRHLARVTARRGILGAPQVAVSAPGLGIDHRFGERAGRFHVASIGKHFTATLVMQAVEAGAFTPETPVSALLPRDELEGLFETEGHADVAAGATVHDLLTHTAGVADYFEGPVTSGRPMQELVLAEPDRFWTSRRPARLQPTAPASGRPPRRAIRVLRHGLHPARSRARAGHRSCIPRAAARAHPHAARHARHRAAVLLDPRERPRRGGRRQRSGRRRRRRRPHRRRTPRPRRRRRSGSRRSASAGTRSARSAA